MAPKKETIEILLKLTGKDAELVKELLSTGENKKSVELKARLDVTGVAFKRLSTWEKSGLNIKTTLDCTGPEYKQLLEWSKKGLNIKANFQPGTGSPTPSKAKNPLAKEYLKNLYDAETPVVKEAIAANKEAKKKPKKQPPQNPLAKSYLDSLYEDAEKEAKQQQKASKKNPTPLAKDYLNTLYARGAQEEKDRKDAIREQKRLDKEARDRAISNYGYEQTRRKQIRDDFKYQQRLAAAQEDYELSLPFSNKQKSLNKSAYKYGFLPSELDPKSRKLFDFRRLKQEGVPESIALSFLLGGPVEAIGATVGGAAGGRGGTVVGAALFNATIGTAIEAFTRVTEAVVKAGEAGLEFERSILGISSVLQATTEIRGAGGGEVPIGEQLAIQQNEARRIQKQARSKLLPLGIAGEKEAVLIQAIVAGAAQRGISLNAEQAATIAERLGGAIQAQRPELFNNSGQLRRDVEDLFNFPGRRTILTSLVSGFAPGIGQAATGDELVRATGGLSRFPEALKGASDNPIVAIQKLTAALDQLNTVSGDAFLKVLIPGVDALSKAIGDDQNIAGFSALMKSLGEVLSLAASTGAAAVSVLSTISTVIAGISKVPIEAFRAIGIAAGFVSKNKPTVTETESRYTVSPKADQYINSLLKLFGEEGVESLTTFTAQDSSVGQLLAIKFIRDLLRTKPEGTDDRLIAGLNSKEIGGLEAFRIRQAGKVSGSLFGDFLEPKTSIENTELQRRAAEENLQIREQAFAGIVPGQTPATQQAQIISELSEAEDTLYLVRKRQYEAVDRLIGAEESIKGGILQLFDTSTFGGQRAAQEVRQRSVDRRLAIIQDQLNEFDASISSGSGSGNSVQEGQLTPSQRLSRELQRDQLEEERRQLRNERRTQGLRETLAVRDDNTSAFDEYGTLQRQLNEKTRDLTRSYQNAVYAIQEFTQSGQLRQLTRQSRILSAVDNVVSRGGTPDSSGLGFNYLDPTSRANFERRLAEEQLAAVQRETSREESGEATDEARLREQAEDYRRRLGNPDTRLPRNYRRGLDYYRRADELTPPPGSPDFSGIIAPDLERLVDNTRNPIPVTVTNWPGGRGGIYSGDPDAPGGSGFLVGGVSTGGGTSTGGRRNRPNPADRRPLGGGTDIDELPSPVDWPDNLPNDPYGRGNNPVPPPPAGGPLEVLQSRYPGMGQDKDQLKQVLIPGTPLVGGVAQMDTVDNYRKSKAEAEPTIIKEGIFKGWTQLSDGSRIPPQPKGDWTLKAGSRSLSATSTTNVCPHGNWQDCPICFKEGKTDKDYFLGEGMSKLPYNTTSSPSTIGAGGISSVDSSLGRNWARFKDGVLEMSPMSDLESTDRFGIPTRPTNKLGQLLRSLADTVKDEQDQSLRGPNAYRDTQHLLGVNQQELDHDLEQLATRGTMNPRLSMLLEAVGGWSPDAPMPGMSGPKSIQEEAQELLDNRGSHWNGRRIPSLGDFVKGGRINAEYASNPLYNPYFGTGPTLDPEKSPYYNMEMSDYAKNPGGFPGTPLNRETIDALRQDGLLDIQPNRSSPFIGPPISADDIRKQFDAPGNFVVTGPGAPVPGNGEEITEVGPMPQWATLGMREADYDPWTNPAKYSSSYMGKTKEELRLQGSANIASGLLGAGATNVKPNPLGTAQAAAIFGGILGSGTSTGYNPGRTIGNSENELKRYSASLPTFSDKELKSIGSKEPVKLDSGTVSTIVDGIVKGFGQVLGSNL